MKEINFHLWEAHISYIISIHQFPLWNFTTVGHFYFEHHQLQFYIFHPWIAWFHSKKQQLIFFKICYLLTLHFVSYRDHLWICHRIKNIRWILRFKEYYCKGQMFRGIWILYEIWCTLLIYSLRYKLFVLPPTSANTLLWAFNQ